MAALLQPMVDKRFEQLERHLLRQTALMELELRTDHNHRAARIIHALAEQVLAEAALLALERIGKRFERAVVGAAQHAAAAAVIEQRVDGFLQHALLIADDHVRRVQLDQLLQPVIAVDHAAVEIVQIGGGKTAAIQRHQRAQLGRDHRNHVQDHPLRLVARFAERFDHPQPLGELQFLLLRRLGLHLFANLFAQRLDVDLLEQLLDSLGAHHGDEFSGEFLIELPLALVADHFTARKPRHLAWIDDHESLEIKHALEFPQGDVQQVADARGQSLEKPDVRAGAGELNVPEPLTAYTRQRHFHTALVANHAAVLHALVLPAQALPVRHRAEDARAEQAIALRLKRAVIDRFRL